jgi:hypothetical protein
VLTGDARDRVLRRGHRQRRSCARNALLTRRSCEESVENVSGRPVNLEGMAETAGLLRKGHHQSRCAADLAGDELVEWDRLLAERAGPGS